MVQAVLGEWSNPERVAEYLSREIPYRDVAEGLLHERFREAIGQEHDDPADRLAGLCEQLDWLCDAGFERVDCRFKWLELALIVAARAPSAPGR
jgi:hypothetical protein